MTSLASRFASMTSEERLTTWLRAPRTSRVTLMRALNDDDLAGFLEILDPDQANDALRMLPARRRPRIVQRVNAQLQEYLQVLSQFDPRTAAGIMSLDYIQVEDTSTIADVAKRFKAHEERTGRAAVIVVVRNGKLCGQLPAYELGLRAVTEVITDHIKRLPTIAHNAEHNDVISAFREHPHGKIAVVNATGHALGIIYSDDVLQLLREQESSSLLSFAGVEQEETVLDSVKQKVQRRYSWLIINLGTAFLAAFTVGLFEDVIAAFVLLAVYMPVVAGMGGNAATQTLAVLVRGIALKQITLASAWPTLRREVTAGFINGVINGVIVAAVIMAFHHDARIALVLGLAMVINLLVAGFFGTLIPLIMQRFGKDPATSATIFITTATDVLGFLAFLGLATIILE